MAEFDTVWAVDGDIAVPSEAEIRAGFRCGPASPGVFNYLFQRLMQVINSLNIGDMVSKTRLIETTEGIRGGGNLEADRTLRLDFSGLQPAAELANDDLLAIFDVSANEHRYTNREDFIAGLGGGGEGGLTGGANIGVGDGLVYSGVSGSNLNFRKLKDGDGINVETVGDDIVFSLANMGAQLTIA